MENGDTDRHIDLTYLREIAKGSDEFIVQMLNIFIDQTPKAFVNIEKALESNDWESLRLAVHKIKPSITFIGLSEIKNDVPLLEEYAASETHLDAIPELVNKIQKVCTKAVIEVKDELQKLQ
jgi:HPt (histidine-containing phosphotransfer) domain-containing protein